MALFSHLYSQEGYAYASKCIEHHIRFEVLYTSLAFV
jgi:hypothetical protein